MSALEDYLRRRGTSPLTQALGTDDDRFKNLLRTVNTYNVNRVGGQALSLAGADIDPSGLTAQQKPGVLSTVFKALNAPRAGLFRVMGVDPELTGSDLFRSSAGDNLLEKAAKTASAFAFDVATDPLTYVGVPGVVGRKAIVQQAASPAVSKLALSVGEEALKKAGRNSDEVVEALFRGNALVKYSDELAQRTAAGVSAGEIAPEAAEAASGLAKRRADLIAKHGSEKGEQLLRRELAEEELGRIVSESLLVGGRSRALNELTRVFGSEDVARSVFNRLPDDVRGGILLRAPWGTTIGRVPFTGRGDAFGRFGELTNQARFNATERIGRAIFGAPKIDPTTGLLKMSRGITGGAGTAGYFGPAWQQVRAGLRDAMSKPGFDILKDNLGRTTTTTYNAFRQAHRNMSAARTAGLFKVWRSLGEARAVERDWTDKGLREDYVRGLWIGYHTPDEVGFGAENLAEQAGIDQARRLRAEMNAWRKEQVDAGIPIGDLGPDAQPLILTPQEQQRLADLTPGGAGAVEGELSYTPQLPRSAYIVSRAEAEANGWSGFLIPDTDNIALNAVSINKKAGRKVAVEDPLRIAEIYMERAAKSVAQKKFVDEALRTGVLVADIDYTQTQARFDRLATFTSGLRKAVPQIADRIEAARASAAKELADQASEAMRDKTIAEATALRIKVNAEYDAAVQGQAAVRARLREATRAARQARPSRGEINARLSGYARSSAELEMQRAEAAYENALERLRAARATTRMEEVPSRSGFTEEEYAAPSSAARDAAQKELDEARAAREGMSASELAELDNYEAALVRRAEELPARSSITEEEYAALEDRYDDLILSGEAKRAAEKELAEVRAVRNRVRNAVSASELAELNNYEAALMRREKVRAEYEAARKVRNKAAERWARFKDLPAVASSAEIQRLAIRYSRAYNAVIRAQRGGADKDTIKSLRDQAKVAAKELRGAIGYKLPKGSPLALYRDTLEKLAKNLGEEEFSAATVMASEAKLTQLLDGMVDAQAANDMAAITSTAEAIKETYLSIRGKISVDDLTGLNALEQRALRAETAGDLPLLREVAKKTKYGEWLTAEDIKQITSNVTTRPPTSLVGLHATSGVRIVLENAYRAETTKAFQKFVSSVVDPLLLMWKTGVTVGRGPGYVMTNLIGGIYMSFLGGVSAQSLSESAVLLNAFRSAYAEARAQLPRASAPEQLERGAKILEKRLAGKMIGKRPAAVVLREFLEFGGYGSTQTVEALQQFRQRGIDVGDRALSYGETVRLTGEPMPSAAGRGYQKVVDLALTNPYQRVMNDWAQNSELFLRFGTYVDTLKKFDDPMMALDRVNLLHFDYSDLSEAEQSIRRLVPFYTWMRHNVPLQLRAMVFEPGKIKKWMYAQENIKAQLEDDEDSWYEQLLPEYLQDVGGFVSRIATDEGPLAFGSRMPYDDINRMFKVGRDPRDIINTRELAKSIGPATTLPLSLATGTNLDTGAAFAPEGVEATGYQALLARVPGLGRTGAEGEARLGSGTAYALGEALPQLSFVDRLLSTTPVTRPLATKPQQQRATSNLLNLLGVPAAAGFSVTTLTPESMTGEARKRVEKQNTILEEAAGKMNVSLEWLRAQIRAGYTSQEIAVMIRRGEGNRELYEKEKSKRSKGLDPRYERMLREMGRGRIELGY